MTDKPHHHGNLRAALIEAGLSLLDEGGVDGLTLRRAAARAGVSHAAPAHHFAGKHGLVIAIAAEGFRRFTAAMESERYTDGDTPEAQLRGICRGYLNFARAYPALFRLIFTADIKGDPDAEMVEAGAAAYQVLADVAALFVPAPQGRGVNELTIWALVHGYANLHGLSRACDPVTGATIPFEALLDQLGLRPLGRDSDP